MEWKLTSGTKASPFQTLLILRRRARLFWAWAACACNHHKQKNVKTWIVNNARLLPNRSTVTWGSQRIALGTLIFHSNTFHFICWAPKLSAFSYEGPYKIFLGSTLVNDNSFTKELRELGRMKNNYCWHSKERKVLEKGPKKVSVQKLVLYLHQLDGPSWEAKQKQLQLEFESWDHETLPQGLLARKSKQEALNLHYPAR